MSLHPNVEAQRAYYDERWAHEQYANLLQLHRAAAILDGLRRLNLRCPKILDLGCGTGWLTAILGRFGPTTGIDLSRTVIRTAQNYHPDVRFIAADFSDLHQADETFDVVVSQEVIEHVIDQARYLDLAAHFLQPGGYLLLTTPNAWNLAHWQRESLEEWGLQPIEQWLTIKQLRTLLAVRFKIIFLRTLSIGNGTRGVFRLVNSKKLAVILHRLHLFAPYERFLEAAGFGRHIMVVAERQ
jgi:2-polyprenyl-3-methyl-5-hydroxy-6-metoxy-1,4-benzoquinol methylase